MTAPVKWSLAAVLTTVVVGGVTVPLVWWLLTRDAATGTACDSRHKGLACALADYHEARGHYPPAFVRGPDGRPWHSWRVLLLPYLSKDELFAEYKFDESWDGPNNRKLHARMPHAFACPSDPDKLARGHTSYFVVVGPGTAFPGDRVTKHADFTRPRGDVVLVVEAAGEEVCWLEPRDLDLDHMSFALGDPTAPSVSAKHNRIIASFGDGTSRRLHGLTPPALRAMFLIRPE